MPTKTLIVNRKSLIVLAIVFLFSLYSLFSFLYSPTMAQTTPLDKAQADYNFQFAKYNDAHTAYTTAKAQYLSFNTAVSKNTAFTKTREYLIQVDNLYLSFIAIVQENANSINWKQSTMQAQQVADLLNSESSYIKTHIQNVQNTKTLEELPQLAQELDEHIAKTTELKLNKVLAILSIAQTESALTDFNSISAILDRVVVFKLRAGETRSILANWSSEISDIKTKTGASLDQAKQDFASNPSETISSSDLGDISQNAQQAQTELKRSKSLFEELVRIL